MNNMKTDEIIKAYEAQEEEERLLIEKKDAKIKEIAESREKSIEKKNKIAEIKAKIIEKRKLMKEKAEVDEKVKKTLKEAEGNEEKWEIEGEEEVVEEEDAEEVADEEETVEEEVAEEDAEKKLPESKQAILAKIAERKKQDILKNIAERKAKAEGAVKVEEKKEEVKEKKEVRVGTLLEAAEGDKKRRFSVYREEKTHFFLKELGTGKTFKIAKEKVELV